MSYWDDDKMTTREREEHDKTKLSPRDQIAEVKERGIQEMPTYTYLCMKGHETEVHQPITDPPLPRCPKMRCEAGAKRLIPKGTSFVLKGGGWTG